MKETLLQLTNKSNETRCCMILKPFKHPSFQMSLFWVSSVYLIYVLLFFTTVPGMQYYVFICMCFVYVFVCSSTCYIKLLLNVRYLLYEIGLTAIKVGYCHSAGQNHCIQRCIKKWNWCGTCRICACVWACCCECTAQKSHYPPGNHHASHF